MTMRALLKDFRPTGVAFVVVAAVSVLAASFVNLGGTRNAYFAIAGFHGYVEGVMLVFLLTRGAARRAYESPVAPASV
jgi:hypothetical protein